MRRCRVERRSLAQCRRRRFSTTPQSVVGLSNAVTVAGSFRATCAVLADGTVRCWGQRFWTAADSALSTATPEGIAGITTAR
jgi:hypothetical protein